MVVNYKFKLPSIDRLLPIKSFRDSIFRSYSNPIISSYYHYIYRFFELAELKETDQALIAG